MSENCPLCGQMATETLRFADLELNIAAARVVRAGIAIKLTSREFAMLAYMMRFPGRALTRTDICNNAWKTDFEGLTNVVDTYAFYLRQKIDKGRTPLIHTVRGIGYTLKIKEHHP